MAIFTKDFGDGNGFGTLPGVNPLISPSMAPQQGRPATGTDQTAHEISAPSRQNAPQFVRQLTNDQVAGRQAQRHEAAVQDVQGRHIRAGETREQARHIEARQPAPPAASKGTTAQVLPFFKPSIPPASAVMIPSTAMVSAGEGGGAGAEAPTYFEPPKPAPPQKSNALLWILGIGGGLLALKAILGGKKGGAEELRRHAIEPPAPAMPPAAEGE